MQNISLLLVYFIAKKFVGLFCVLHVLCPTRHATQRKLKNDINSHYLLSPNMDNFSNLCMILLKYRIIIII